MDVYECLKSCIEVRRFKPEPVPKTVVTRILQAGRWAPNSRNLQPWHFIVIRERETLKTIGGITTTGPFVAQAPLAIAIVMDNADRPELDAGRALQQMALTAWSDGIGTCFVGLRDPQQNRKVKQMLSIPPEMELITVMPFGYSAERIVGSGKRRSPLADMVHAEKFGQRHEE